MGFAVRVELLVTQLVLELGFAVILWFRFVYSTGTDLN